mmetsp:Transcript_78532/g.244616  ORF Transcript_78532/g.244616 Transcript_78532/m.244616 type:complete len:202 (-) Transcript_78532:12-617(-)
MMPVSARQHARMPWPTKKKTSMPPNAVLAKKTALTAMKKAFTPKSDTRAQSRATYAKLTCTRIATTPSLLYLSTTLGSCAVPTTTVRPQDIRPVNMAPPSAPRRACLRRASSRRSLIHASSASSVLAAPEFQDLHGLDKRSLRALQSRPPSRQRRSLSACQCHPAKTKRRVTKHAHSMLVKPETIPRRGSSGGEGQSLQGP